MTITVTIPKKTKPTVEQLKEIREAAQRPIVYDEDCPRQTPEQLKRFRRVNPRGATKEIERIMQ